ncbi:hypothetical protein PVAP13_3KG535650 [Panicum virgatum]|uniref:Uncharacterized protein n=1 Tax=Panicum virgatum TaxID=38727 RepID=A0A8T0VB89_PANVG|nr:hypothetical protein PVAP13_3KG535650 [Panicum virgatum]
MILRPLLSRRRNRSRLHPSSRRRSSGDVPCAALLRAFLHCPPPCLPASPALVPPCNTLRRRTLRHPAPAAAIGRLPVSDPRATPAKGCAAGPPPDPARHPLLVPNLAIRALPGDPLVRRGGANVLPISLTRRGPAPTPPCPLSSCSLKVSVPATVQRRTSHLLHRRDPAPLSTLQLTRVASSANPPPAILERP